MPNTGEELRTGRRKGRDPDLNALMGDAEN